MKQRELGRPEAASSKRTSADTLISGLMPLKMQLVSIIIRAAASHATCEYLR